MNNPNKLQFANETQMAYGMMTKLNDTIPLPVEVSYATNGKGIIVDIDGLLDHTAK